MSAIFISYRREDTEGHAGRLFEGLRARFGDESVFMDVAHIEPGVDFRQVIDRKVAGCGVLLALIGPRWLDLPNGQGKRRIDDDNDFVRIETAAALRRGIPVIPVLVQGARMPNAGDLPPDLADLAFRNGVELTHARWESDLEVLARALARHMGSDGEKPAGTAPAKGEASPGSGWKKIVAGLVVVAALASGIAMFQGGGSPAPEPAPGPNVPVDAGTVDAHSVRQIEYEGMGGDPRGHFAQTGPNTWTEFDPGNSRTFNFKEINRDGRAVYLRDDRRMMDIVLDLGSGRVLFRDQNTAEYSPLYRIVGAH